MRYNNFFSLVYLLFRCVRKKLCYFIIVTGPARKNTLRYNINSFLVHISSLCKSCHEYAALCDPLLSLPLVKKSWQEDAWCYKSFVFLLLSCR